MPEVRQRRWLLAVAVAALWPLFQLVSSSCTDAGLYGKGMEDASKDRIAFRGRVCTDDPKELGFPVRVILMVDASLGPVFANYDPELLRLQALRDLVGTYAGSDGFSFAVIGYGARARLLAPTENSGEYFTRNPGQIESAISTLGLPMACQTGKCRDYRDGFDLARALIDGDMKDLDAGTLSRTQYAVLFVSAGMPTPLDCAEDCVAAPDVPIPDTDTENERPCTQDVACTITQMRDEIVELRDTIERKGVASFSVHSVMLSAVDPTVDPAVAQAVLNDQFQPLMSELAFVGGGRFERFNVADQITFDRIPLRKVSSLFDTKSLMVTNLNVLPGRAGAPVIDSDGDGLSDEDERNFGTSPLNADSDKDGISDLIEVRMSFDPQAPFAKDAAELKVCVIVDGPPYADTDNDRLNDCEELIIGTDRSLPDTDGDAIPDWLELVLATDYLTPDALLDADEDGVANGEEIKQHTNPRSSDASAHLGSAYRYDVTDDGMLKQAAFSKPQRITGVELLAAGEDSIGGLGTLRFEPGNPPRINWQAPEDDSAGPALAITKAGEYKLLSGSAESAKLELWINVRINPTLLSTTQATERILLNWSERHCLSFKVRNIKLMETQSATGEGGQNNILIYFGQAPMDRLTLPGVFRVAHIPVTYHEGKGRTPDAMMLDIRDEEFVVIGY